MTQKRPKTGQGGGRGPRRFSEVQVTEERVAEVAMAVENSTKNLADEDRALLHFIFAVAGEALDQAGLGPRVEGFAFSHEPAVVRFVRGDVPPVSAGIRAIFDGGVSGFRLDPADLRGAAAYLIKTP